MTDTVECETHGEQQETFVCSHLAESLTARVPVGFWCSNNRETERPDAWCSPCEEMSGGGDWNEENEKLAGIRLLCGRCYDSVRQLNLPANGR